MTRLQLFVIFISLAFVAVSALYYFRGMLQPQKAGIFIDASPASQVYVDGDLVGVTPFEGSFSPGEKVVRVIPESSSFPLSPYETRLTLVSNVKTVVRRIFGPTEEQSSGETITFEKFGGEEASISLVTIPDSAQIKIDGVPRGFAPVKISRISPGEHSLNIVANGYIPSSFSVIALKGYQLTVISKLALDPNPSPVPSPTPTPTPKESIVILDTPTGFLRVRQEPSKTSTEIGQVRPGDTFEVLSEENGWYKIEYKDGDEGWVSGEFAKIQ